jgi:hypothetical protein
MTRKVACLVGLTEVIRTLATAAPAPRSEPTPERAAAKSEFRARGLPVETLQRLATELFGGHARFDPELDLLVSANTKVRALGTAPESFDPERPRYPESVGPWSTGGVVGLPPSPQARPAGKRPGWA